MSETFTCEKYNLPMPKEKQVGFCAKQFRIAKAGDFCLECEHGKASAKADAEAVRSGLTIHDPERRSAAGKKAFEARKIKEGKEAVDMAGKKECKKGCGVKAVKDDLCHKHYKEVHGEAPFPSGRLLDAKKKKSSKTRPDQIVSSPGKKSSRVKGNGHTLVAGECEGCKATAVLVAAGVISAEKLEQARTIVKELHG